MQPETAVGRWVISRSRYQPLLWPTMSGSCDRRVHFDRQPKKETELRDALVEAS